MFLNFAFWVLRLVKGAGLLIYWRWLAFGHSGCCAVTPLSVIIPLACFQVHSCCTQTELFVISVNTHPHSACFFIQNTMHFLLFLCNYFSSYSFRCKQEYNAEYDMEMMRTWCRSKKSLTALNFKLWNLGFFWAKIRFLVSFSSFALMFK